MTTQYIVNHFKRKGYYIALCMNTNNIIVKKGHESKLFNSYAAAHKHYFGY